MEWRKSSPPQPTCATLSCVGRRCWRPPGPMWHPPPLPLLPRLSRWPAAVAEVVASGVAEQLAAAANARNCFNEAGGGAGGRRCRRRRRRCRFCAAPLPLTVGDGIADGSDRWCRRALRASRGVGRCCRYRAVAASPFAPPAVPPGDTVVRHEQCVKWTGIRRNDRQHESDNISVPPPTPPIYPPRPECGAWPQHPSRLPPSP